MRSYDRYTGGLPAVPYPGGRKGTTEALQFPKSLIQGVEHVITLVTFRMLGRDSKLRLERILRQHTHDPRTSETGELVTHICVEWI